MRDRAVRNAPWLLFALMSALVARMASNANVGHEGTRNAIAATMAFYMLPCLYAALRIRRVGQEQRTVRMSLFSVWAVVLAALPDSLNANDNMWALWGLFVMPAVAYPLARWSSKIVTDLR